MTHSFATHFYYGVQRITRQLQWRELLDTLTDSPVIPLDLSQERVRSDLFKIIEFIGNQKRGNTPQDFEKALLKHIQETPDSPKRDYACRLIKAASDRLLLDEALSEDYLSQAPGLNRNIYEAQDFRDNLRELKNFLQHYRFMLGHANQSLSIAERNYRTKVRS